MAIIAPTLPTIGEPRGDGEADVRNTLNTLVSLVNGQIDDANVATGLAAYSTWKNLATMRGWGVAQNLASGNVYILSSDSALLPPGGQTMYDAALPIVGTDWTAGSRTTQLRLRVGFYTNAVAPAANFVLRLYTVATVGGGSGVAPLVGSVSAVGGSDTSTITAPGASGVTDVVGGAVTAGSSTYVVGLTVSTTMAANSSVAAVAMVQYRQT